MLSVWMKLFQAEFGAFPKHPYTCQVGSTHVSFCFCIPGITLFLFYWISEMLECRVMHKLLSLPTNDPSLWEDSFRIGRGDVYLTLTKQFLSLESFGRLEQEHYLWAPDRNFHMKFRIWFLVGGPKQILNHLYSTFFSAALKANED